MENVPSSTETALSLAPQPAPVRESVPAVLLEDRVAQLEQRVAMLSVLQGWEESSAPPAPKLITQAEPLRATPIPPPPTASLAEFALPPLHSVEQRAPSLFQPMKTVLPITAQLVNRVLPASSLWRDLWWDVHTLWRLMRDPYYPKTTSFKVVPLFALFYVTIWPWLFTWGGLVGSIMSFFVNAVVLYIAFKVIQRELRRYYDFAEKHHR
jgi:hypothetical protein